MGLVLIGTSGYNYDDWKGNFYPEYLDKKDYLKYYSGIFKTVEINFTYYSFPIPYIFKNFLKKTENNFIFSVKAHSSFTHNRDFKEEDCTKFFDSLKPIYDTKKMGPILFQFPWSFKFGNENMDYIKKISSNTKKTFIYFNNHYKAKAVNSAKLLINLLAGKDIVTSQN